MSCNTRLPIWRTEAGAGLSAYQTTAKASTFTARLVRTNSSLARQGGTESRRCRKGPDAQEVVEPISVRLHEIEERINDISDSVKPQTRWLAGEGPQRCKRGHGRRP